jgi:alkanesulfonate monooxygenase
MAAGYGDRYIAECPFSMGEVEVVSLPVFHRGGFPEAHGVTGWGHSRGGRALKPGVAGDENITQEHRVELARAAERLGYDSILSIMTDRHYDPFVATSFLAAHTSRIKFIVALRPGTVHPTWAARQAQTFQEMSGDRLYLNIITGSHERELRALGETLAKADRYARTSEFFDVLKLAFTGQPFDYEGAHYSIEQGGLPRPLAVTPRLFIGGSSPEGMAVAGKHAEIHLSYSETPPLIAETIGRVREQAAGHGRSIEFGILISVIARETSRAAWAETDHILDHLDVEQAQINRSIISARNSVGEARVQSLSHGTDLRDRQSLKIYPNIWAGPNRTTLVGSYAEVAERIEEYRAAGVKHFIIQGQPTMNSIIEFGEGVMPYFARPVADRAA